MKKKYQIIKAVLLCRDSHMLSVIYAFVKSLLTD